MSNILSFPVEPKLKALNTRIRALLKVYEHSDDKELQLELLTMSATVFILGEEEEGPDVNQALVKVEKDLEEIEVATKLKSVELLDERKRKDHTETVVGKFLMEQEITEGNFDDGLLVKFPKGIHIKYFLSEGTECGCTEEEFYFYEAYVNIPKEFVESFTKMAEKEDNMFDFALYGFIDPETGALDDCLAYLDMEDLEQFNKFAAWARAQ